MPKRSSRVVLTCTANSYRRQDIPGTKTGKVSTAYISATNIVQHLDLDDWMEVNPRVPKRSRKGVLSGHVVSGITRTIDENPNDFALKNLGLYLLAESVDHDRQTDELKIVLDDKSSHGLCNGGHTYAAIRAYAEAAKMSNPNDDEEANLRGTFVRVQIYEGIESEKVVEIAEGLNRSRQVDDASLDDLKKNFDIIQTAMSGRPGADEIGYHMGDINGKDEPCAYYITDIVRYLMFFNCERFDGDKHPYSLYRYQKKTMDFFREDLEGPAKLVCRHAPEILQLWHQICLALPNASTGERRYRRMEVKPRSRDGKANTAGSFHTELHFIGKSVDCAILNGWVMPMVAAFRANVEWDLAANRFEWKQDPSEVIPHVIGDFYRICAEAHDNGRKPDEIGRDGSIYSQMYDKVDQFLMRQELIKAREELAKLQSAR